MTVCLEAKIATAEVVHIDASLIRADVNWETLQIPPDRHRHHYVNARVPVHEYPDRTLALFHGPRCLARYNADGEPIETPTRQAA